MSSTLNKIFCRVLACVLCLCILLSLTACSPVSSNISKADQICVSGALYESWMYVLTDEAFIDKTVDIFKSLDCKKSDDAVNMMDAGEVLSFTFNQGDKTLGKVIVDSNNRVCFEAGGQSYDITSEFDFDYVKRLVDDEIEKVKSSFEDKK